MELWDIYDIDRNRTGITIDRDDPDANRDYHLVIHVCIINSDRKMLIQQRQPFKKGWSGLWDVSVGGHAVAGDDSRTAAKREVKEELGLDLDFTGLRPSISVSWKHGFDDIYVYQADVDISSVVLQPEEVKDVRWADAEEIKTMIDNESFIPYHKGLIDFIFLQTNIQGTHTRQDRRKG